MRDAIRTSQLKNRLENYVFGKVTLEPAQVTAALGLLRKTLPDLSAVDATHHLPGVHVQGSLFKEPEK